MGRLSAGEIAAIAAGAPTRQVWQIVVPTASGAGITGGEVHTVHDDASGPHLVTSSGDYTVSGYNVSMASRGRMSSGMYIFRVDNADGLFYPATSSNYWYNSGDTYQAQPVECYVKHYLYVLVDGAWSELIEYIGRIRQIDYDDAENTATIEGYTEAVEFLSNPWTDEDGTEYTTGMEVYN